MKPPILVNTWHSRLKEALGLVPVGGWLVLEEYLT